MSPRPLSKATATNRANNFRGAPVSGRVLSPFGFLLLVAVLETDGGEMDGAGVTVEGVNEEGGDMEGVDEEGVDEEGVVILLKNHFLRKSIV